MTALVKREPQSLAYNQDQIQTIKDTFAKGASDAELRPFIAVAERRGLDIFARKAELIAEMKAAICGAGATEAEFDDFARDKDLHNRTVKWLEEALPKIIAKMSHKSVQPEPASEYAGQRADGARKVLRTNADGEQVAVWEEKTSLEQIDDLVEDWREKGQDLATIKNHCQDVVGIFQSFHELNAVEQAKVIRCLETWVPKPRSAEVKK